MASLAGKLQTARSEDARVARNLMDWRSLFRQRVKKFGDDYTIHHAVEELLDLGFSKRMIGTLLGAGATEVMRWHSTAICRMDEEREIAALLSFCDLLETRMQNTDPAAWFEVQLVSSCVINMQEIYYNHHIFLLLDYAFRRKTAEQVLDEYEPAWRDVPPSMWEVAVSPDGELYIRMKGDGDA